VLWDKDHDLLTIEADLVEKPISKTDRCCGNSPGKSHTRVHDTSPDFVEVTRTPFSRPKSPPQHLPLKTLKASPNKQETKISIKTQPVKQISKPAVKSNI
jgi:hypothetical protein